MRRFFVASHGAVAELLMARLMAQLANGAKKRPSDASASEGRELFVVHSDYSSAETNVINA